MYMSRQLLSEIRSMLELHLTAYQIAHRMCLSEGTVNFAIDLLNRIGDDFVREGKEPPKFWSNIIFATPGERPEDAFDTRRMMLKMKYAVHSCACFAPYPGSALGNQLIAEGKSLMSSDNYHRFLGDRKLKGVNYEFYDRLLNTNDYDVAIYRGLEKWGK